MAEYCKDMTLMQQGAEARLYESTYFGKACVVKERFSKTYRHPEIDEKLTRKRVSQEVRALQRCRKVGIHTPAIFFVDLFNNVLFLEKIEGVTVREHIKSARKLPSDGDVYSDVFETARSIGAVLAKLHDADIIHGDLTTSNMIIKSDGETSVIYLIDFGLSGNSTMAEDKAVDLYVLERAFLSSHPGSDALFSMLLDSYQKESAKSKAVLDKLDEVRQRGRKRSMLG